MVEVVALNAIKLLGGIEEGGAATNDNTFLRGSSSGAESVLDAVLELADLDLGSTADLDNGNATSESSHALLELLTVVLACRVFHGCANGIDTLLDILRAAFATHKNRVILRNDQQLDCALDLMRRLPPQQIEKNLSDLIDLVPDLCEAGINS